MKTLFAFAFIAVLSTEVFSQPLSGSYTIGGSSPDFATFQEAANSVKLNGVSSPVFFNIRPGIYTRDGGASTLFKLDSIITGASPTNRITFQPDAATGGNVDNVILQADFNSSSSSRILAIVYTDYTTLRNLTFKDADSMDTPVINFIYSSTGSDPANSTLEDFEVDGCKFIGTNFFPQFGSDIGIQSNQYLTNAKFTNNKFYRICRGITNENGSTRGGTIIVEDNQFYQGYGTLTGTGNAIGAAIELACTHASVKRNIIDLAGGCGASSGIYVLSTTTAVIERNLIKNRVACSVDGFTGISVRNIFFTTDSIIISNNAIFSNSAVQSTYIINIEAPNTKVLYNTIANTSGFGGNNIALNLRANNCTILNNIILELSSASFVAFDQGFAGQSQNLVSDYNIIYLPEGHGASGLVRRDGVTFATLEGYQAATGLDSHSVYKTITFSDGFHLDTCQAQDPDLIGIPITDITIDYDGTSRDDVRPFKGADESVRIPFDMFADGFRAGLSGPPLSLAEGDFFDNDDDDDIAVPDYDNDQILLFRNLGSGRSFVHSGTVFTTMQPTVIKLFDFDQDGHLDLIVAGDTSAVDVFWGDGVGSFGTRVTVETFGRVRSIEPEPFQQSSFKTVWLTEDNGFLSTTGFLGYIFNLGNRQLCHDLKYKQGPPPSFFYEHDTIPSVMTDLVAGNIDMNSNYEIIALGINPIPSKLVVFQNLLPLNINAICSDIGYDGVYNQYQFGTGSYVGHNSGIVFGDFDNDDDNDLITTSASENSCILIRNLGNVQLTVGDTIPTTQTRGIVVLDYESDGDLDFVAANRTLYDYGITVFLNDGLGNFTAKPNCFFPFASGFPNGIIASDFDLDGKTDIAIASSFDSLFVLYNLGGFNGTTDVDETNQQTFVPAEFSLSQNYPNPFNPSTKIDYTLPSESNVKISVFNILGEKIKELVNNQMSAGNHSVNFNASNLASGIYIYQIEVRTLSGNANFITAKKMILMK